jgi:ankyrin repeat protein
MIDASLRLRRAIHAGDVLLTKRILLSHPHLLHNPDTSLAGLSNTNLHLAATLGHLTIVKLLLAQGHDTPLPQLNERGQTALLLAAQAGHTDVVHQLAESQPAQTILRRDRRGRDAVMEAARGGHDTVLQILLTYAPAGAAAAVGAADNDGNTALHFASSYGHLLVLRTLLAAGADAGRRNAWNWTAVDYSATVQAEVYLKGLVAEVEKRRALGGGENKGGHGAGAGAGAGSGSGSGTSNKGGMRMGVRLVQRNDDESD